MKPVFEKPIVEIIELNEKDVILTSGCGYRENEIADEDQL